MIAGLTVVELHNQCLWVWKKKGCLGRSGGGPRLTKVFFWQISLAWRDLRPVHPSIYSNSQFNRQHHRRLRPEAAAERHGQQRTFTEPAMGSRVPRTPIETPMPAGDSTHAKDLPSPDITMHLDVRRTTSRDHRRSTGALLGCTAN